MAGSTLSLGLLITASAGAAHGALQSLGQNIERLKTRTREATEAHARLGDKVALLGRKNRPIDGLTQSYVKLGNTIEAAQLTAERFAATQDKIASHRAAMGELWGQAAGVAGLAVSLGAPIRAAVSFESAMADVRKVVDGSDEQIAGLGDTLKRMAREIPLAQEELAQLAASGGQLGVALGDLPDFVATTARMAVAFDMAAEEAGDAMAKVANVYQIPIGEIGRLGDAINQISNESPAKAREIVQALSRVGGVARSFGLSADAAAALSGAFIAMGKPPEVAATGINAMLTKLMTADKQGKAFQDGLAAIGLSAEALKQGIEQDAQGALLGFLKTLEQLPKEQRMGVLVDLFGLEYADDIAALSGSLDVYVAQLDATQRAEGSMGKEFAARAATTANNWQLLRNTVSELGIEIGSVLLPALNELIGSLRPIIEGLAEWARAHPALAGGIMKLGAALLAFKAGSLAVRAAWHGLALSLFGTIGRLQALRSAWLATSLAMQTKSLAPMLGNAVPAAAGLGARLREIANSGAPLKAIGWHLGSLGAAAKTAALAVGGALKGALMTAGRAVLWLGRAVMLNPIGLVLSAAALLVYKFWGPISGFFKGLWAGLKAGLSGIGEGVRAAFAPLMPLLKPIMPALTWLGDKVRAIAGWFGDLAKPIEDTGGAAQAFGARVGQAIGEAVRLFLSLPGKLIALPGQMLSMGGELVSGLVEGVKARLGAAREAVAGLGESIKSTFKGWLGIRSPSRVFAGFGQMVGEGAAQGISGMAGQVGKASAALALAATTAFQPALALPAVADATRPIRQAVEPVDLPAVADATRTIRQVIEPVALPAVADATRTIRQVIEPVALPGLAQQRIDSAEMSVLRATKTGASDTAPMQITFAPQITVTGAASPDAARAQVTQAVQMSFAEFERLMRRYELERRRIAP
jgi:TP901 family phage tail tape measure protein